MRRELALVCSARATRHMAALLHPSHALVSRPRVVGRVSEAIERGNVVLVAAAGYGKTTVLQETLAARSGPTIWISCAAHADAGLLLLALVQRLREAVPGSADVIAERLAATLQRVDVLALAKSLRADVEQLVVEPVVVVLDDAEELERSPEAVELANILLHSDPRALRLALASRRPLALRVAKLVAAGHLTQLGAHDLAFDAQECAETLSRRSGRPATSDEVDAVMASTEGWPLGVALSAAGEGHAGTSPHAGRETLYAFLDEEVFGGLDDDLRSGALDAAAALDLTVPVIEALGLPADFPARAQRAGLLLRPSGDQQQSWSFHPLLREFLRAQLALERSPAELSSIHARIAGALAGSGREREAVEHWLAAGDWRAALDTAVRLGHQLQRVSPTMIRSWLGRLPPAAWDEPVAQLVLGQLERSAGRHERAIAPLRAAVAGYDARGEVAAAWLARSILCDVLFSTGGFEEILQLTEGWDDPALAALAPLPLGVAWYSAFVLLSQGRHDRAAELLGRLRADRKHAPMMRHLDSMYEAYREISRGRVDVALDLMASSVGELEEYDPGNRACYALAAWALMLTNSGQRAEALAAWEQLVGKAELAGLAIAVNSAHWSRACLLAEAGDLTGAQDELERGGPPAGGGCHDRSYYTAQAAIAVLRDEPAAAVTAAERALELVAPAALNFRVWTACELAPSLVAAGAPQRARRAVEETLVAVDEAFPGDLGRYLRARLLAVRAWIASLEGDLPAADADVARAWAEAQGCEQHVLRSEWARLEPLVGRALERGALAPSAVVGALQRAFPGGVALVAFIDHPLPEVRRVALSAAMSSGHPGALARLEALAADPDPGVAAAAAAAREGMRRSPPPLTVHLLGGFRVRRATWDFDEGVWGRPLVARLVRFLVIHRESAVPEDLLFDAFWSDKDPAAARRNLAVALSLARKALDVPGSVDSVIHTVGRTHQLRLRPADRVDSDEFELAAAAALAATGPPAVPALARAEALWGGDPLPEERYSDWTFAWRERLIDRYAHVLAELTRAHTNAGRTADAIRLARKCVELDPLNEDAQRELIASYARAGRRNHALRQFLACRRVLVDELGIEPSQETVRLHERVLAGSAV